MPKHAGISDYWRVVRSNIPYRLAFISYCIDNVGNWLTFVACISITNRVGGSLHTSAYLITRLLPSFLFAGVIGPLADKWDKRWLMIGCALGSALSVSILLFPVDDWTLLCIVFVSASMQFTFAALYEPVRNSLIPLMMSPEDLIIATTLDSMGWSTVGAVGAALGGAVNSSLGDRISFLMDVISYCLCACLVYNIPAEYGHVSSLKQLSDASSGAKSEASTLELSSLSDDTVGLLEANDMIITTNSGDIGNNTCPVMTDSAVKASDGGLGDVDIASDTDTHTGSFSEGMLYVASNKFILWLCCMKGSGALAWGLADILAVKFSEMKRNQSLGDADVTLGLTFAMVGLGCQVGPVLWNNWTPQAERPLFLAVVLSLVEITVSYTITIFATNIYAFLFAIFIRCIGSAVIWVYSTLLVQTIVPARIQGRVFTIERAVYVLCEMSSVLLGGVVFTEWDMTVRHTCIMMTVISALISSVWSMMYAWRYCGSISSKSLEIHDGTT